MRAGEATDTFQMCVAFVCCWYCLVSIDRRPCVCPRARAACGRSFTGAWFCALLILTVRACVRALLMCNVYMYVCMYAQHAYAHVCVCVSYLLSSAHYLLILGCVADGLAWLVGWLVGWFVGWLVVCQIDTILCTTADGTVTSPKRLASRHRVTLSDGGASSSSNKYAYHRPSRHA